MRKTLTYTSFIAASLTMVLLFVTATTYAQLYAAILLYPVLIYIYVTLEVRPHRKSRVGAVTMSTVEPSQKLEAEVMPENEVEEIADIDKRAFLKFIGIAGFSLFLFSIFSRKAEVPFFGKIGGGGTTTLKNIEGATIDPAERQPMDGFQISEIDDDILTYYGFTNKKGAWIIMREDTENTSFRYAKGEGEFPNNWSIREQIQYDYFHNVFKS